MTTTTDTKQHDIDFMHSIAKQCAFEDCRDTKWTAGSTDRKSHKYLVRETVSSITGSRIISKREFYCDSMREVVKSIRISNDYIRKEAPGIYTAMRNGTYRTYNVLRIY